MNDQDWTPERIAGLLDEIAELAARNHSLLRQLDEARQRRIHVLTDDGTGSCVLCFTGRYEIASAHTWLAVHPNGTTLLRVDKVPVVECDTCAHLAGDTRRRVAAEHAARSGRADPGRAVPGGAHQLARPAVMTVRSLLPVAGCAVEPPTATGRTVLSTSGCLDGRQIRPPR